MSNNEKIGGIPAADVWNLFTVDAVHGETFHGQVRTIQCFLDDGPNPGRYVLTNHLDDRVIVTLEERPPLPWNAVFVDGPVGDEAKHGGSCGEWSSVDVFVEMGLMPGVYELHHGSFSMTIELEESNNDLLLDRVETHDFDDCQVRHLFYKNGQHCLGIDVDGEEVAASEIFAGEELAVVKAPMVPGLRFVGVSPDGHRVVELLGVGVHRVYPT
jgi:hypothetical protein